MASSSLTCPPSSRRTICSSSASASSKFIAVISAGTSTSTICALPSRLREQDAVRQLQEGANSANVAQLQQRRARLVPSHRHQHSNVRRDAGGERRQVITSFERRHDPSTGMTIGDVDEPLGDPNEIVFI